MASATSWLGGIILMLITAGLKAAAIDPRVGQGIAVTTAGAGVATALDWIPSGIGNLAALIGIILSAVLIVLHVMKGHLERKKLRLEIAIIQEKEAERIKRSEARRESGAPERRKDE